MAGHWNIPGNNYLSPRCKWIMIAGHGYSTKAVHSKRHTQVENHNGEALEQHENHQ